MRAMVRAVKPILPAETSVYLTGLVAFCGMSNPTIAPCARRRDIAIRKMILFFDLHQTAGARKGARLKEFRT